MTAAAQPAPVVLAERSESHDVVLILSYTSWSGAVARGFIHSEDRLAAHLIGASRVRRLLVCNPYRSGPIRIARRALGQRDASFPTSPDRHLYEPRRLRRSDPTGVRAIERSSAAYERAVRDEADRLGLRRPAVITTHPLMAGFGDFEWASSVTYYTNDDMTAYPPVRRWWPAYKVSFARSRAARRRAVALTPLSLASVGPGGPAAVIPSGIEPGEWIDPGEAPEWFRELPGPRLLYVGTLDERIDVDQVRAVAEAHPEGSVVLVGRCPEAERFRSLTSNLNVTLRPGVPRDELRGLVAGADVGLVPHVRSAQTEAMSPLKLYEYLAAGLPVAATELPGIAGVCDERVVLARDAGEIADAVDRALSLGRWGDGPRRRFIEENAWSRRFDTLLDLVLAP